MALMAMGVLIAASISDQRAHTRAHQERRVLATARQQLARAKFDVASLLYARGLAGGHLLGAQDSLTVTQGHLQSTQQTLATTSKAEFLQGLDIGTLGTCLSGVKGAYQQIAAHDNAAATGDIAGASSDCLALDAGQAAGLVYAFDFPDPFVLRVGNTYFAYATNSAEGNIQIISSTDLIHWDAVGNALPKLPVWAAPDQTWAPSVLQVGEDFVLYYSAVVAGVHGGEQCISAATATQPQGPFIDNSGSPLVCQSEIGGSIDPSPFVSSNGTPYLQWKSNGGAGQPATIWSEQLSGAGTGFAATASPVRLLQPDQRWEGGVVEAPDLVLAGGHYYLFYSGNNWNSADYAVGVAACRGPLGPCSGGSSQPLLDSGSQMAGPGGEDVFTDASGNWWMAFDAWVPGAVGYPHSRALYVRPLSFSGTAPAVLAPG
jgi:hypothetical protein